MKVIWLSGRVIGSDLCSTTQISLMDGLQERGIECTMYSPGRIERDWHLCVKQSSIKGFQARSVAKSILKKGLPSCDLVILDWRLAKWIIPTLQRRKIPWLLMDRSPPADAGFLAKFQRKHWKRAWELSAQGCTVSKGHTDLILEFTKAKTHVIPAGVNTKSFIPKKKTEGLNLVYHGRLDHHRGVSSLLEIARTLHQQGIPICLNLIGKGSMSKSLNTMDEDWLNYHGSVPHSSIPQLLSNMDVGLSPMDDRETWAISSPLKLAEYAAAGLQVLATDQPGNHFEFEAEWIHFVSIENWVKDAVKVLSDFEPKGEPARDAAKYLDWSYSVDALLAAIEE